MIVAGRLLPHAWNATPAAAVALFAAARLGVPLSVAVALAAMLASDLAIGLYDAPVMIAVYASLAITALIGRLLAHRPGAGRVAAASVASSALFFVVTNWAVWQFGTMYSHDLAGLLRSYEMGLPFLKNAIFGDLVYTGMLFGAYEFAVRRSIVPVCITTARSRPIPTARTTP